MTFLSARDFTLVMLAIVFFAGAACIALLLPLPSAVNAGLSAGLSALALLMLLLALFPHWFRRLRKQPAKPIGRPAS